MSGSIGTRNFSDPTVRQISSNISRQNFKERMVSDSKLQKFRDAVLTLVAGWTTEDKLLIISQYGDNKYLGRHPSEKKINAVVAESLIIHLDPSDLQQLYNDVMVKKSQLKKDVKMIQKRNSKRHPRSFFSISNFESNYQVLKDIKTKSAGKYNRTRNKLLKGFKVPRYIRRQYGSLRKEIYQVLEDVYNKVQINQLAASMGIEIEAGTKTKELKDSIVNKVCLYVDLLVGKNKKGYAYTGAFDSIAPYEEVLQYTSFSYILGGSKIDDKTWMEKRRAAAEAKRTLKARAKAQRALDTSAKGLGKITRPISRILKAGALRRGYIDYYKPDLNDAEDVAFAENIKTLEGLDIEARKLGIDPYTFKGDQYTLMAEVIAERKRQRKKQNKKLKWASKESLREKVLKNTWGGPFGIFRTSKTQAARRIKDTRSIIRDSVNSSMKSPDTVRKETAEKFMANPDNVKKYTVPVVNINTSGEVDGELSNLAVPVYVVNQIKGVGSGSSSNTNAPYKEGIGSNVSLVEQYQRLFGQSPTNGKNDIELRYHASTGMFLAKNHKSDPRELTSRVFQDGRKMPGDIVKVKNEDLEWAIRNRQQFATGGTSLIVGDSLNGRENPELVTVKGDGSISVNPLKSSKANGFSPYSLDNTPKFATGAMSLVSGDLQKTIERLSDTVVEMKDDTGDIKRSLSTLLIGMAAPWISAAPGGVGPITNPVLTGMVAKEKIEDISTETMQGVFNTAKEAVGLSTGGKVMRAATGASIKRNRHSISRFATGGTSVITGDARNSNIFANGARPELVQSNGDMVITPLNKAGTEQKQKVSRMTSTERNSALATGISSHVVKYNYSLPGDATDVSNVGEAIKVLNVKPGLTDLIDVSGTKTTVAEMLIGIMGQLSAIVSSSTVGNELLTAIASKPIANVQQSSSGSSNPYESSGFPSTLDSILGGK